MCLEPGPSSSHSKEQLLQAFASAKTLLLPAAFPSATSFPRLMGKAAAAPTLSSSAARTELSIRCLVHTQTSVARSPMHHQVSIRASHAPQCQHTHRILRPEQESVVRIRCWQMCCNDHVPKLDATATGLSYGKEYMALQVLSTCCPSTCHAKQLKQECCGVYCNGPWAAYHWMSP